MLNLDVLQAWRRADLERVIYGRHIGQPGKIAGDIVLGPRSIRLSFDHFEAVPFVALSAEGHTRCSDRDVARFMKFARLRPLREIGPITKGTFVRTFDVEAAK